MNNLIAIRHTDPSVLHSLLNSAQEYKLRIENGQSVELSTKRIIGLLFFENSTRTRVSFEQAATYLGFRCVTFFGAGSSISKGETLKDTILTLKHERLEAMVIRHNSCGACSLASKYFSGPVINAGDGRHEHPTQALTDAMTIIQRKGKIEGLTVAIVGDIANSRVARSNAWLLSKMGAKIRFVGPRPLMPGNTSKFPVDVFYDLNSGIEGADVVMALRLQRERMEDGLISTSEFRRLYQINRRSLRMAAPDAIVMHPGPMNRGVEIDDLTADGPNSTISEQVSNSIFVRIAVLSHAFGDTPSQGGLA